MLAYVNALGQIISGSATVAQVIVGANGVATVGAVVSDAYAGLSITWTAVAGHQYVIEATGQMLMSTAGDLCVAYMTDGGGTTQYFQRLSCPAANTYLPLVLRTPWSSFAPGPTTRKLMIQRLAGAGTIQGIAGAADRATITVYDVTP